MIYNYIAFILAGSFLLLSVVSVTAEKFPPDNVKLRRFFRRLKISLREITHIQFIFIALIVLIAGSWFKSCNKKLLWLALGIFFLGEIILHFYKIISHKPIKHGSSVKGLALLTPLAELAKERSLAPELPETALAKTLEPLEPLPEDQDAPDDDPQEN